MKKLMLTVVAAASAAVTWAGVTTSGKNITVSGTGNVMQSTDPEAQVTMEASASANIISSAGATVIMKNGGALTLGASTESWKDKVAVWLDASKTETIEYWGGTTLYQGRRKVQRWYDWRDTEKTSWRIGAPRQVSSDYLTTPSYSPATADGFAFVCYNAYMGWGSRSYMYNKADDDLIMPKLLDTGPNTLLKAKAMIMVFGSQNGGGAYPFGSKPRATLSVPPLAASVGIFNENIPTYLDGESVNPTTTGFNGGWQVVSVMPTSEINAYQWGCPGYSINSTTYYGGQNYAEILIFTNTITTAERISAERYLAEKYGLTYKGGESANDTRLFGSGSVTVSDGNAEVGGNFSGTLNVAEGATVNFTDTKTVPTAPAVVENGGKNMLWYDPSNSALLSYGDPSAQTLASKKLTLKNVANTSWYPLNGGARSAAVVCNAMANGPELPWLYYQQSLAGNQLMMRFVDDGSATGNTFDTCTGFFVLDTTCGGGTFFKDTSVYTSTYMKDRSSASSPIFNPNAGYEWITNSPAYLNGVEVNSGKHNFNSRGEVVSFTLSQTIPVKNFNSYTQSGDTFHTRHGEVLLYKNPLTENQRKDTEAYLMNKWLGITPAGYGDLSGVTVAGAGKVTLSSTLHPKFAADYSGDIDASAATTLNFTYDSDGVADPIQTTGELTLADAITVDVDFETIPSAQSGTIVLAKGATLTGGTTVTLTEASKSYFESASLTLADNQLTLTYERSKLLCWRVTGLTAMQQAEFDHAELVVNEGMGLKVLTGEVAYDTIASTKLTDYTGSEYRFEIRYYNAKGIAIGVSPTYTYEELRDYVEGSAGALEPATYTSGSYTLPRADWTALGYSFAQQLTNAVVLAANGATITILPGDAAYNLGAVYMKETSYKNNDTTTPVVVKSYAHIYIPNKVLHFVGDTTAQWSGAVTLTGSGRFFMNSNNGATTFEGITFKGFAACDTPKEEPVSSSGGNLNAWSLGAAICGNETMIATNCVFEGCNARSGGATAYIISRDCKYKGNWGCYNGGAAVYGRYYGCWFEANHCADAGAIWWPLVLEDCDFVENYASGGNGAITADKTYNYKNVRFIRNHAKYGGAMNLRPNSIYHDLVFIENYATAYGGAINAINDQMPGTGNYGNLGAENAQVVNCIFSNNYVTAENGNRLGGAIYAMAVATTTASGTQYLKPVTITGCKFVGNYVTTAANSAAGGAIYGGMISNCVFEANYVEGSTKDAAAYGGAVYVYYASSNMPEIVDSIFISNRIEIAGGLCKGVAIYNDAPAAKCERCGFDGNYLIAVTNYKDSEIGKIVCSGRTGDGRYRLTDCWFTNNVVECGGLVNNAIIRNCQFVNNDVTRYGACAIDSEVYDTKFIGNMKFNRHYPNVGKYTYYDYAIDSNIMGQGVDALKSKLYGCYMDGGILNDCVINGCVIEKCNAKGSWCVFGYGNYVTNTLIAAVSGPSMRAIIYRWGAIATTGATPWYNEFVNCTFADNTHYGKSSAPGFMACQYKETASSHTFKTKVLNCVFNNNRSIKDTVTTYDLSAAIGVSDAAQPEDYKDIIIASNCVWGVAPKFIDYNNIGVEIAGAAYTDLGGNRECSAAAQRLVKSDAQAAALGVAKYTPKGGSPVRGKGDASVFAEDAKDLAGNPRVVGGKVDVGCYQSTLPINPALIWVK